MHPRGAPQPLRSQWQARRARPSACAKAAHASPLDTQEESRRVIEVGQGGGFKRSQAGDGVQSVRASSSFVVLARRSLATLDYVPRPWPCDTHPGAHLLNLVVLARCMPE